MDLGTCACEAGASGDLESIRVLVDNGADINQGDYDGRTGESDEGSQQGCRSVHGGSW